MPLEPHAERMASTEMETEGDGAHSASQAVLALPRKISGKNCDEAAAQSRVDVTGMPPEPRRVHGFGDERDERGCSLLCQRCCACALPEIIEKQSLAKFRTNATEMPLSIWPRRTWRRKRTEPACQLCRAFRSLWKY